MTDSDKEIETKGSILGLGVGDDSDPHLLAWRPPTPPPSDDNDDNDDDDENVYDQSSNKQTTTWKRKVWNNLGFSSSKDKKGYSSDRYEQDMDFNAHDDDNDDDDDSIIRKSPTTTSSKNSSSSIQRARSLSGDLDDLLLQDESQKDKKKLKRILFQDDTKKEKKQKSSWLSRNRRIRQDENDNDLNHTSNTSSSSSSSSYHMMRSFHGPQQIKDEEINRTAKLNNNPSLQSPSEEEKMRDKCSFLYTGMDDMERQRQQINNRRGYTNILRSSSSSSPPPPSPSGIRGEMSHEYFSHPSRIDSFVEQHNSLNLRSPKNGDTESDGHPEDSFLDDDDDPFLHLFGSPTKGRKQQQQQQPLSSISQSSLSFVDGDRVQIRLPNDNVRLMMDPYLESGILSVELGSNQSSLAASGNSGKQASELNTKAKDNTNKRSSFMADDIESIPITTQTSSRNEEESNLLSHQDLNYVLTVNENVYKQVIKEISDSKTPCGLYYCCHDAEESSHVSIGVAIGILTIVFGLLFAATIIWPLE